MHPRFGNSTIRGAAVLACACSIGASATTTAAAQQKAVPVFENGQAQLVPAFQDSTAWIRQELWVETEFDTDGDGKKDRMHVDVTRPRQSDTEGLRVSVIYESSPYFAGTSGPRANLWDVRQELGAKPTPRVHQPEIPFEPVRPRISNDLIDEWVPRGFAVVHSEAPGTGLSQGCPTVGDTPERLAPKAVIDWLNGRARGFTSRTGNEEVKATWSTGKVGMIGTSYNGTLPLAAATTGVEGLEVVIPVSPNTSYYHYYRTNGLVRHPGGWLGEDIDFLYDFIHSGDTATRAYCNRTYRDGLFAAAGHRDRTTGDYNDFWASRDLLPHVKNIKSAVLLAHGFNDWNVVPEHSLRVYEEMKAHRLPVSIYLHQGGHGGNPPADMVNRWFSHYLYGVDNGVEKDPRAWIVHEEAAQAAQAKAAAEFAERIAAARAAGDTTVGRGPEAMRRMRARDRRNRPERTRPTPYADFPVPGSVPVVLHPVAGGRAVGSLALSASGHEGKEKLTDDVSFSGSALAASESSPHRLLYATAVLTDSVHISGTPRVKLRLASSKPAANLTIWLVQLPFDSTSIGTDIQASLITRGWADPQNYRSLTGGGNYDSKRPGEKLVPGKFYDLTFDIEPSDEIIPAGKRIGVMIMSSDREFTLWPAPGTELTVDLDASSFTIPIVGGAKALGGE
ncbi:MAG TPA: Xaa-Pro dipeptidyl-peptidase [Gemmatimonadaceae bacterium]|nr:Xaa-Pro dipeptidyl-peptidase [Gemmatimonadaceae bacterium]